MNIALQLYSVREDIHDDLEDVLVKVRGMGYEGVEFAGLYDRSPAALRRDMERIGILPLSAHVGVDLLTADPERCAADYGELGCRYIAVPWLDENRRPGNPGYGQFKADLHRIAAACERQGLVLLYHNHDFEFMRMPDGEYALDRLYREVPVLQTEIDTCWVRSAGEDPAAYVRKYAGRAPVVHLKDYYMTGKKPDFLVQLPGVDAAVDPAEPGVFESRPLGYGMQDIPSLVEASADAGASWVVVEQDFAGMGKSPLKCAEMSIRFLQSLA